MIDGTHTSCGSRLNAHHHVRDALASELCLLNGAVGEPEDRFRDGELARRLREVEGVLPLQPVRLLGAGR
ncbi:Uncharacterised protein [Mycobacteroides abscessus subsp. abscessus]|nr:Uncharacterised protein [Mycobacteroides abscessus subsp. abscessus]